MSARPARDKIRRSSTGDTAAGRPGLIRTAVAGGSPAVRAESCRRCRGYRQILYQEEDTGVKPIADDLASLALDLLMSAEGYHRSSSNPLLWLKLEAP